MASDMTAERPEQHCYWNEGRDYVLENRADAVAAACGEVLASALELRGTDLKSMGESLAVYRFE
jgi:hypothetical protein